MLKLEKETQDILICPLYSQLPKEEQMIAIEKSDKRKIILATNIIESSITIDNLLYGICIPYHKIQKMTDDGYSSLELMECSKSNIIQRHGRIGRGIDIPGFTKVLMTRKNYNNLKEFQSKEIDENPLYYSILKFYASNFYTKYNISIYAFFHGINTNRINEDIKYLINYNLLIKSGTQYKLTEIGKYIVYLATSIPNGYVMYHAINSIPKKFWFSLCVILATQDVKFNPFYIPRDKRDDQTYIESFTKWNKKDDMDTLFGLLNEYQTKYYLRTEQGWIRNNNLYQQFFHDIWNSAKRLFTSMVNLSLEMMKNSQNIIHDNNNEDNNNDYEKVYPYHMIKNMMSELFLKHMPNKVFVHNGTQYITKKEYDDIISKKNQIIKSYYNYNITKIKNNIKFVIDSTNKDYLIKELTDILNTFDSVVDKDNNIDELNLQILLNKATEIHKSILTEYIKKMNTDLTQLLTNSNISFDEIKNEAIRMAIFAQNIDFIKNGGSYYNGTTDPNEFDINKENSPEAQNEKKSITIIKESISDIIGREPSNRFSISKDIKYINDNSIPFMLIALNVFMTNTSSCSKFGYLSYIIIPDNLEYEQIKWQHINKQLLDINKKFIPETNFDSNYNIDSELDFNDSNSDTYSNSDYTDDDY